MCCCISEDVFLRYSDFLSPTSFESKFMKGRRFRLLLDKHIVLEKLVQWIEKPLGGFDLMGGIIMGEDSVMVIQFY